MRGFVSTTIHNPGKFQSSNDANRHALAGTMKHESRHSGKHLAGTQKSLMDIGFRRYEGKAFIEKI